MEIVIGAGVALVVLIVGLALYINSRPAQFRIERSATISAPAEKIFPLINDFSRWTEWSPWDKIDPDLKRTYSGPSSGPGAIYSWAGKKAGEGRMTLLESKPNDRVLIKLQFIKPFAATNRTTFTLTPAQGGTKVHWCMEGENAFIGKAFSLVMNMDKMVGKDFEKGLASMNDAAQASRS